MKMKVRKMRNLSKDSFKRRRQLIERVIEIILEEPKRFNWREWFLRRDIDESEESFSERAHDRKGRAPECGTVGCVAGWTSVLIGQQGSDALGVANDTLGVANALGLDLNSTAADKLFYGFNLCPELDSLNSGTKAYAKAAARYLREWLKKVESGEFPTTSQRF